MIIINKDRDQIINMDNVNYIHLNRRDQSQVMISYINGSDIMAGEYKTVAEAKAAMELLWFRLGRHTVVALPTDEEVETEISSRSISVDAEKISAEMSSAVKKEIDHYNERKNL